MARHLVRKLIHIYRQEQEQREAAFNRIILRLTELETEVALLRNKVDPDLEVLQMMQDTMDAVTERENP